MPLRLLLALLLSLAMPAAAATVRAFVEPETIQSGQIVTYGIEVLNGDYQGMPGLQMPQQIVIQSGMSQQQRFSFINGQRSMSMTLSWQVLASEPGEFTIPPQELIVDGQKVRTNEVRVKVGQPGERPGKNGGTGLDESLTPLFQLEVARTEMYLGEVVPLKATLYIPRRLAARRIGLIDVSKSDFAITRFPQNAEQSETVINGIGYIVVSYRTTLTPLQAGDLKVGPAKVELTYEVMEERRSMPGFPPGFFMGGGAARQMFVTSPDVKVKVKALPMEGKPAGFTGAVGDFQITATATPNSLAVGDPLAVEMVVEGTGNFDALNTPALNPADVWRTYPARRYNVDAPQDPNQINAFVAPGSARRVGFSQVLVPEKVQTELPPFELSFFSPTQKRYVTVKSQPVPLQIKPGAAPIAESGSTGTATNAPKAPAVVQPLPDLQDILIHPPAKPVWVNATAQASLMANTTFWAAQGIPVGLLVLALIIAVIRKRRAARLGGRRGELLGLWRGLEESGLDDRTFLQRAVWFIQRAHDGAPPEGDDVRRVVERYEQSCFTAGANGPALTTAEKRGILTALRPLLQKAALLLLSLMLISVATPVQAADEPAALENYRQAREQLLKGDYTKAQYFAESILRQKDPLISADVFTLIGHARYRLDDPGRAALWYQRAALLDPLNPELRQNLRHLDEKLRFFTLLQASWITEASLWLPRNTWILLAAGGAWLILLALTARVLIGHASPLNSGRRVLVIVSIVLGFLVLAPAATLAALRPEPAARVKDIVVITRPESSLYSAATVTSSALLDIPPGSQARLLEERGDWSYIEVPGTQDGPLRGWVEATVWQKLWNWSLTPLE